MIEKQINDLHFYMRPTKVLLQYHRQVVCFHVYDKKTHQERRHHMQKFTNEIMERPSLTISDVFEIARESKVKSMGVTSGVNHTTGKIRMLW